MSQDGPNRKAQSVGCSGGAVEVGKGEGKEGDHPLLVVTAFAGTGKTTTLRAYAQARPDRK